MFKRFYRLSYLKITILFLFMLYGQIYAYGPDGHCLVALLGRDFALPQTSAKLSAIFPSDKELCEAACWPDYIKYKNGYRWSYEHHFMPEPLWSSNEEDSQADDDDDDDDNNFSNTNKDYNQCNVEWEFYSIYSVMAAVFNWIFMKILIIFQWIGNWFYVPTDPEIFKRDHSHQDDGSCPPFSLKRNCANGICIMAALSNHTYFLQSHAKLNMKNPEVIESFKFLIHLMADAHQVMHLCHWKMGGNLQRVRYNNTLTDLHTIWDTDLLITNALKHGSMDRYYRHLLSELSRLRSAEKFDILFNYGNTNAPNNSKNRKISTLTEARIEFKPDISWYASWISGIHCRYGERAWDLPDLEKDLLLDSNYFDTVSSAITELLIMAGLRLSFVLDTILA